MSTQSRARSIEAIIFDLVLLAFVGALVGSSILDLGPRARLVPLIIGVPTLIGIVILLLFDLFPGLRASLSRLNPASEARPAVERSGPETGGEASEQTPSEADPLALAMEGEEDEQSEENPEAGRRELIFAAWVVGFFALTAIFGLLISIPVALFFFFKVLNREGWVLTLAMTVGTWAFIYVLFGLVLGVRL